MDLNSHSHDSNGAATGRKQGLPFFRHICKLSQLCMNAGYRCSVCKAAGLGALGSTDALGALSVAAEKAAGLESAGIADGKAAGPIA